MFSDTNLLFVTVWPTVLLALSVILVSAEYLIFKKRAVFTVVSGVFSACACGVFLWRGCSLCDLLVLICATLALRLFFEIRERRKAG